MHREVDPTPGTPDTGDLHWEDESLLTSGFENQWDFLKIIGLNSKSQRAIGN